MKKLIFGSMLTLLAVGRVAAPVVVSSFYQAGINSAVTFNITNPDATYDSGVFRFDDILTPVAQAVKDNNSAYSGISLADIMSEWTVGVEPNEVYSGWSATRNGPDLDMTNNGGFPNLDYAEWLKTSVNPNQDEFAFTVNFFGQLDFDNSGTYEGIEQLTKLDSKVSEGFTGTYDSLNKYSTDVNQIGVVPEPATMTMLGLAGLLIAAKRRFFA